MKNFIIPALLILSACGNPESAAIKEEVKLIEKHEMQKDTTPKVTGVGGVFFFSDDPKNTKEWYSKNLGFQTDAYGTMFESRDIRDPDRINKLQWSLFKTGNAYFKPSEKPFMINYTVQNLEGLVRNLKGNGVTICDSIEAYDYGKFIHIMDPEGNKIELWEPMNPGTQKADSLTKK